MTANGRQSIWNETLCKALGEMVTGGYSFCAIANDLSTRFAVRITRNACIGKARRMGLETPVKRQLVPMPPKARQPRQRRSYTKIIAQGGGHTVIYTTSYFEQQRLRCAEVLPRLIPLSQLNQLSECHYIPGEDHLYCGHPAIPGKSWCGPHWALVRGPAQ